ncbi:MAG: hypothetical protein QOI58_1355 [Thermoanaerobaculia bacterium]|nr:hypothetical protein [Thermoanaerobaculia bacterium]
MNQRDVFDTFIAAGFAFSGFRGDGRGATRGETRTDVHTISFAIRGTSRRKAAQYRASGALTGIDTSVSPVLFPYITTA